MANILSVSLFPRYKMSGRHLVPLVTSACKRTLYDDGSVDLQEISAAEYRAATGEGRAAAYDAIFPPTESVRCSFDPDDYPVR